MTPSVAGISIRPPLPEDETRKTWMAIVTAACGAVSSGLPQTVTSDSGATYTVTPIMASHWLCSVLPDAAVFRAESDVAP